MLKLKFDKNIVTPFVGHHLRLKFLLGCEPQLQTERFPLLTVKDSRVHDLSHVRVRKGISGCGF